MRVETPLTGLRLGNTAIRECQDVPRFVEEKQQLLFCPEL
jgi:hypothetical protein